MSIDTSGKWWRGTAFPDISEYLQALKPGGYDVTLVLEARCTCGSTSFHLRLDRDEELGQTECATCSLRTFVADSEALWSEARPKVLRCICKHNVFRVGLGLSIRDGEWVLWGSLGTLCSKCHVLASPLDWKSDLDLSDPEAYRVASGTILTGAA